ncbi:glutamyl aminopeptidase-like isoform X1 [Paramuricea clavata]|uniref:Glutamyl aminopeptidase-like isoform X1 n=1 Tax=Paramuricea clavata TaxID=317549 RepID=A0A6S7K0P5_PARCT|nr:glutamyl aminopeptidase-like isoform X1 [Paramuricea clavata]
MRTMILNAACSFGHEKSIVKAKKLFTEYLNSGSELDVDLRKVIYYHGIANTGIKEWQKLFEIHQYSTVASERRQLLHGLSASKEPTILLKLLNFSIDESKIRSQNTVTVINSVAQNPIGQSLAWKFLTQNWKVFYERYSKTSFQLARLISSTTSMMNTKNELQKVKDFFHGRDKGSGTKAVDISIERIVANINWMERSPQQIKRYLDGYEYKT